MELLTEEYLRSTSSIAHKVGQDLDAARDAYQELWHTLSRQQQRQVLDEAVIDPAAVLKYATATANNGNIQDLSNRNKFSWFTRSQLNLFTDETLRRPKTPARRAESAVTAVANNTAQQQPMAADSKTKDNNNLLNKIKNKVTNLKIPSTTEEKQSLVETSRQAPSVVKSALSKPKTPPPPPPSQKAGGEKKALLSVDIESDHDDDIPKTGFDFLDNW